jgi:hypothetical protein
VAGGNVLNGERNDDLTQEDILKVGKLVRSMLQFEPSKRASAREMLQGSRENSPTPRWSIARQLL